MRTQFAVRIEPELKERFSRLAQSEGRSSSEVIRELMTAYVTEHDIAGYIDQVWLRVRRSMADAGSSVADVPRAISEVRKSKT